MSKVKPLTDRERILTILVSALHTSQMLADPRRNLYDDPSEGYRRDVGGHYAHFAYWQKPKAGDLVIGQTGSVSEWKIGFYVEPLSDSLGGAVIREIGSNRLCDYSNESFFPIVGLSSEDLYEGDKYRFYCKVIQAFRKGGEYNYRRGAVEIENDTATIWVREAFGGINRPSKPFFVKMEWNRKTSIKTILTTMREQGYGTRAFDLIEPAPQISS